MLKALTHAYEKASAWLVWGAQLLGASGWRPDCTVAKQINIKRIRPPICIPTSPIIISDPEVKLHQHSKHRGLEMWRDSSGAEVEIYTSAPFQDGIGASCACAAPPGAAPEIHG